MTVLDEREAGYVSFLRALLTGLRKNDTKRFQPMMAKDSRSEEASLQHTWQEARPSYKQEVTRGGSVYLTSDLGVVLLASEAILEMPWYSTSNKLTAVPAIFMILLHEEMT